MTRPKERNLITVEEVRCNVEGMSPAGALPRLRLCSNSALLANNYDWLSSHSFLSVLRGAFSVNNHRQICLEGPRVAFLHGVLLPSHGFQAPVQGFMAAASRWQTTVRLWGRTVRKSGRGLWPDPAAPC